MHLIPPGAALSASEAAGLAYPSQRRAFRKAESRLWSNGFSITTRHLPTSAIWLSLITQAPRGSSFRTSSLTASGESHSGSANRRGFLDIAFLLAP